MVENKQAKMDEVIETYNGKYQTCGRTITDVHEAERMSMADGVIFTMCNQLLDPELPGRLEQRKPRFPIS